MSDAAQATPNAVSSTTAPNAPKAEGAAATQQTQTTEKQTVLTQDVSQQVKSAEAQKPSEASKPQDVKYELKLPEGSLLDAGRVEKIASFAKEQGFSPAQAQAILERENSAVGEHVAIQKQQYDKLINDWAQQVQSDKELGGENFTKSVQAAQAFVKKYFSDAFIKDLNSSGYGNYPELIRGFARAGKELLSDKLVVPGSQASASTKKPMEEIFYGKAPSSGS